MKRFLSTLIIGVVIITTATSCKGFRDFVSRDLEDEDYIIGALYADEYVEEQPVIKAPKENNGNKLGLAVDNKDNPKLYKAIESWYGTPYKYGGCSTSGVDCSCFVGSIFKEVYGIELHRSANEMQKDVTPVSRGKLREGDLVFFTNSNGKVSHVGIYLKDDMFVHSSTSKGVMISKLSNSYWATHFHQGGRHKAVETKR
ncbi:MAG: C40 family peptidase [Bacteroidales bacterium]|nr:C40 family peptidase [Bacteroidales bacterium]